MDNDKIVHKIFEILENLNKNSTAENSKTEVHDSNVIYSLLAFVIVLLLTTLAKLVNLQSLSSQCCNLKRNSDRSEP